MGGFAERSGGLSNFAGWIGRLLPGFAEQMPRRHDPLRPTGTGLAGDGLESTLRIIRRIIYLLLYTVQ